MLRIIEDGERREFTVDGSVIYYTPATWSGMQAAREAARNQSTLRITEGAVERELLRSNVVGWDNVQDAAGKPVPFTHEALMHLPPTVIDTLLVSIYVEVKKEEIEQGNSEGSSTT